LLGQINGAGASQCLLIYTADGGQSGVSTFAFTLATSAKFNAVALELSGQKTSAMIDGTPASGASSASSTSVATPFINPTATNELALAFVAAAPTTATWTGTGGYTTVTTGAGTAYNLMVVESLNLATGATTQDTGTLGSVAYAATATVAIFGAPTGVYGITTTGAGR